MRAKRRTLWLAATVTILLALLAACLLLDSQPFDPHDVTATILGYETNFEKPGAVEILVCNNSPRTIFCDKRTAVYLHYNGDSKIFPRGNCNLLIPIDHENATGIEVPFQTVPPASHAPAWLKNILPDRLTQPRAFCVSAKLGN